jgi:hypothetical protein
MLFFSSIPMLTWKRKGRDRVKKRQTNVMVTTTGMPSNPQDILR